MEDKSIVNIFDENYKSPLQYWYNNLLVGLGDDILAYIFSFVAKHRREWLALFLTCKIWYKTGKKIMDPSMDDNFALRFFFFFFCF